MICNMRFQETPEHGLNVIGRDLTKAVTEKQRKDIRMLVAKAKLDSAINERVGISAILETMNDRRNRSLSPGQITLVDARDAIVLKKRLTVVGRQIGGLTAAYNRLQNS